MWSYAAFLLMLLASVAVTALGFRELSDRAMGIYALAIATAAIMAVVDPALAMGVARSVSRVASGHARAHNEREFIRVAHAVLVWAGIGLLVLASALGLAAWSFGWTEMDHANWGMIACIALGCCVQIGTAALPGVLTGHSDFYHQARASLVQAVVLVGLTACLLPTLGVAALGLAQLSAIVISRATLVRLARRYDPGLSTLVPLRPTRAGIRRLLRFATPLLVVAVAAQVIAWSDLVVLGAVVSASVVALFRVGTIVPASAVTLIYRAYDVAFPRLSRGDDSWQEMATATLTRVFSAVAAVAFAGTIALRGDVVRIVTGHSDHLAELVMVLASATWAISVPAHGLILLAISRDEQAPLTPLVCCEAVVNVSLTLLLVKTWEPAGAAVATLVTLTVSNLIVLPILLRRRVPGAVQLVLYDGALPLVVAGLPSLLILESLSDVIASFTFRLVVIGIVGLGLLATASACAAGQAGRRAIKLSLRVET